MSSASRLSRSDSVRPRFSGVPEIETEMLPAPSEANSFITVAITPFTMVIREITAVTPMMMPSVVRKVLILLLLIFSQES